MNAFDFSHPAGPVVERVRHESKERALQVGEVVQVTPGMLRITFVGDDLADFASAAFDDHFKILVPSASGPWERRDYTPRRYDRQARTLVVDFAVHEAGPATRWALDARPGDSLRLVGPKGSKVITAGAAQRWLLIGDETALPAIGRHIEEGRPGVEITSVVAVVGPEERQDFHAAATLTALWAYRPLSRAGDPAALLSALGRVEILPNTFVWIAAEANVARALRKHLAEERGHPAGWMKAAGYWVMGRADAHERLG